MSSILSGRVIRGDGYGARLGFPTANIDRRHWARFRIKPRLGVYAGLITLANGKKYKAGIVVGPMDAKGLPKLEAHLLGFTGNLYGHRIIIELRRYLRAFRIYKTEKGLKVGIKKDIERVAMLLK